MDYVSNDSKRGYDVIEDDTRKDFETRKAPDTDDAVYELARKRVREKNTLILQFIDYGIIIGFLLVTLDLNWYDRYVPSLMFGVLWGIRLLYRFFKFIKPSFSGGIRSYIQNYSKNKIDAEYIRLKKLKGR